MTRHAVQPESMPRPKGHYSPAVIHNGVVYISGQLPVDPATGLAMEGGMEAQAGQALRNMAMTIYVSDVRKWDAVNAVYAQMLGNHRPGRAIVPVGPLHSGALLEIQAIAST